MTTEYLLNREVEHVLAALTGPNRVVCRVALHTGLRVGDVLALTPAKIKAHAIIIEQKTGKPRMVGFPADLRREMRQCAGENWIFPGRNDPTKHRTRQAVYQDMKRAAKAFRLPQVVGPHSLRKVYAVNLLQKYGDIQRVQRALNHSSPAVTMIYAMADKLLTESQGKRRARTR